MSFEYRGLKAELKRHIVTKEDVDMQLQRMQQQTPKITVIDNRPTKMGDEVLLNYAGFCDGVQFPGGTAEKQTLVLGSGSFIPGFEEQLVDKVPGEDVVVKVMFPAQYHAEDLAGKAAEFRCKILEIREKSSYELDDVFAKEVGGCETFAELLEKLTMSMQNYADERSEMDLQDRLLRQAAATLEVIPSEEQVNAEVDEQIRIMSAQLAQQGLSLEMYCQFTNTTEDKLREDARANAEASVRAQMAIEQVISLEKLETDPEEIQQALEIIAQQNRMTVEQMKPFMTPEFEAAVAHSVLTSKVMKLIRDSAEIVENTDEK